MDKENIGYEVMMSDDVKVLMSLLHRDSYLDICYDISLCTDNTLLLVNFKIIDSKLKIVKVRQITPEFIATFIKTKESKIETKNEHETKVCRSCQRDGCWCGQLSECLDCHGRGKIPCKECRK